MARAVLCLLACLVPGMALAGPMLFERDLAIPPIVADSGAPAPCTITYLIADVVTGKLDVREAAALLPEESASPDPGGLDDELSDDLDPSDEPTPDDPEP